MAGPTIKTRSLIDKTTNTLLFCSDAMIVLVQVQYLSLFRVNVLRIHD